MLHLAVGSLVAEDGLFDHETVAWNRYALHLLIFGQVRRVPLDLLRLGVELYACTLKRVPRLGQVGNGLALKRVRYEKKRKLLRLCIRR